MVGNLTFSDKSIVNVIGFRLLKIKRFDGIVRSLGGVAYVPKMCKNLISWSLLNSQEYGFYANGGVVKVT